MRKIYAIVGLFSILALISLVMYQLPLIQELYSERYLYNYPVHGDMVERHTRDARNIFLFSFISQVGFFSSMAILCFRKAFGEKKK